MTATIEGLFIGTPRELEGEKGRWKSSFGRRPAPGRVAVGEAPSFGENLLVAGLEERSVCIGDVWEVGGARLQVSQPRWPCAKIEMYNRLPGLLVRVRATGRYGWLLRVLRSGELGAGDAVSLVERPHPAWPVSRVFANLEGLVAGDPAAVPDARALGGLTALAASWRAGLEKHLVQQAH